MIISFDTLPPVPTLKPSIAPALTALRCADDDPFRSSFVQGFLQFDLVFQLWSDDNATFYKKRLVRGLRLNEDFARGVCLCVWEDKRAGWVGEE